MPGRPRQHQTPLGFVPTPGWPPGLTDVESAQAGDRRLRQDLLAIAYRKLVAFYRGLGLSRPDAEDLAADTCESVVRGLPGLRDPAAFEAWFWVIARNRFRGLLRRRRREPLFEAVPPPGAGPGDEIELAEEHAEIRAAFARLSQRDRELLWLREVAGLSYEEMAGRLGVAGGAVRVAVHRSRRRLAAAYREAAEGGV